MEEGRVNVSTRPIETRLKGETNEMDVCWSLVKMISSRFDDCRDEWGETHSPRRWPGSFRGGQWAPFDEL